MAQNENTPKPSVLIVDDTPANLAAFTASLENDNYDLVVAHSGKEALKHLMTGDFAVAVIDVNMPSLNGFELAKLVREREKTRQLPIIFITATQREEVEVYQGYSIGAVDYISTPVPPEILKAKVRVFVDLFHKTEQVKEQAILLEQGRQASRARQLHEDHEREKLQEKERVAELMKKKAEELERSNAELEQFASVASHDLQEPLRAIISNCQIIEEKLSGKLDAETNESLHFVVDGAKRMQQLIRGLLEYSRIHQEDSEYSEFDCNALFGEVLNNLDSIIKESGATISSDPLPTHMTGNSIQIGQLLQNLIQNAMKFKGTAKPQISVQVKMEKGERLFSVKDNGIGIDPKYFERIFVIFQRLHGRNEFQGAGIGLAVCKKIVERHGGRIWVSSTPGKGTTFFFTIPEVVTEKKAA